MPLICHDLVYSPELGCPELMRLCAVRWGAQFGSSAEFFILRPEDRVLSLNKAVVETSKLLTSVSLLGRHIFWVNFV